MPIQRTRWPLFLVVLLALGLVAASRLRLRINWTTSMPVGLYRETEPELRRGTLVAVCLAGEAARLGRERGYLPRGDCPSGVAQVVKTIAAVPGDTVSLERAAFRVNGRRIDGAVLARQDRHGRDLPHVVLGTHRVADGHYWVLGSRRDISWDSRYFGPVRAEQIVVSVEPVLTVGTAERPRGENVEREVSILHTREQGLRVHGLADLGGLVAIAGLEDTPPDLLLGALLEVAERLPRLRSDRREEIAKRGSERLRERNAEKRAWEARKRARDLHRLDLTSDQIRLLIERLGGIPPEERDGLVLALSEHLAEGGRGARAAMERSRGMRLLGPAADEVE